jgi:hypothetical protein
MTAGIDTVQRSTARDLRLGTGIVFAAIIVVIGLLIAGQAGMLPRSPAYDGQPGDQYLSQQTIGERFAAP